jgi:hypothetical protein
VSIRTKASKKRSQKFGKRMPRGVFVVAFHARAPAAGVALVHGIARPEDLCVAIYGRVIAATIDRIHEIVLALPFHCSALIDVGRPHALGVHDLSAP